MLEAALSSHLKMGSSSSTVLPTLLSLLSLHGPKHINASQTTLLIDRFEAHQTATAKT